jgi:hypothetical protein
VSGWDDTESIMVGDRRMRVRRRRTPTHRVRPWLIIVIIVVLAAAGVGVYLYQHRPTGLDAINGPAIVTTGSFQAKDNGSDTITVALEIRNVTDQTVTVVGARLVPPAGLTQLAVAVLAPGDQNQNLNLDAEVPASAPVALGTGGVDRNGIVEARFHVDCAAVPPTTAATSEQIFVTVRLGDDQQEEELTPPVLPGTATQWLTATAQDVCHRAPDGGPIPSQLPTL